MKKITPRQQEILTFIKDYRRNTGFPPTRRDITEEFGFKSPNAAEEHLRALAFKGFIELRRHTSRGIILPDSESEDSLPVIGRVAAGSPVEAIEHVERRVAVSSEMFTPRADYLLRVQGESMIDAGILDGDLLAVHRTVDIREGQIVVARVEDEVTVKRFKTGRVPNEIILEAENQDYQPILVDMNVHTVQIEGIGVGVIRLNT